MQIVHFSTELAPIAKVGGLADVVFGLSNELINQGHNVEVIIPKYDTIDYSKIKNLHVHFRELWSYDGPDKYNNTIWAGEIGKIKVLLLEPHHPSYFFSRGSIYGCPDNIERFLYFTRACMEFLYKSDRKPDCIHLHDWPVAVASTLYKDMYMPLGYRCGGTLLTIHNMEHQGKCSVEHLYKIGLSGGSYLKADRHQDPNDPSKINLLKGSIEDSHWITTVSPTYSKEILTPNEGEGLENTLQKNIHKLSGILNGIDYKFWNPKTDHHLVYKYPTKASDSLELIPIAKGKQENQRQLRTHLGLQDIDCPLIGCVTRLVKQKGPELIFEMAKKTIEYGAQFVLLGSEQSPEIFEALMKLKKEFENTNQFGLLLDKNESIAHLIFAGSDFIIVPSIFEPCGLTQLIALRYGTVPIVRKTGGLADTVFDISDSSIPQNKNNGFIFTEPTKESASQAIERAIDIWKHQKGALQRLIINGFQNDYSWKKSAKEYAKIYSHISKLEN
jgi:starch synthase